LNSNTPRRRPLADPEGCFFRIVGGSGDGSELPLERPVWALRASPTFEQEGVDDVSAPAFRTGLSRPFGVHLKLMVAVEAEVGTSLPSSGWSGMLG
jgi:hypothetical protein